MSLFNREGAVRQFRELTTLPHDPETKQAFKPHAPLMEMLIEHVYDWIATYHKSPVMYREIREGTEYLISGAALKDAISFLVENGNLEVAKDDTWAKSSWRVKRD
jgi:hypothetical protein